MGKEISLIAFLDEVVSRNTQHYRKDFELDAQKLRDALNSPYRRLHTQHSEKTPLGLHYYG